MSVKYCLPVLVFHFWPKLTHTAGVFSAIAELLVSHRSVVDVADCRISVASQDIVGGRIPKY